MNTLHFVQKGVHMFPISRFTLIELIIVIAIIAIIGAILIPNFLNTTDRARLRSDVQTTRVLQNAMELYNTEQGGQLGTGSITDVIARLNTTGYIDADRVRLQTRGAAFTLVDGRVRLNLSGSDVPENVRTTLVSQLSSQERAYVVSAP